MLDMNKAWGNIANAAKNIVCSLIHVIQGFNTPGHPPLTKYTCSRCNGRLSLEDHNKTTIFYRCLVCGKIHKARKNRVLGRF